METVKAILEILKWPVVALLGFLIFKKPIALLLSRVTSVGKEGLKAEPSTDQPLQDQKQPSQVQELIRSLDSIVLQQQQKVIHGYLDDHKLDSHSDAAELLIRLLAGTQLNLMFEQIYRLIFGSQIFLLKRANENRDQGLTEEFVTGHFVHVQKLFSPAFDQWDANIYTRFLLRSNLMLHADSSYKLTNFGVDFLQWMAMAGIPEQKNL